ncbi:hypothetical protein HUT18_00130 [Streptomyces sp. NA04227]|uniref:hypothetical protein n=1 Tax=Streptomyces sp. NA04227 TaxID=2742136 RepID=UPI001590DE2F|nr:hypothetical protein [Streptomyces sp. NA04227]QKW04994.1 hypothetical protein HUT18_00130 [Streptomyces sp. NA04227]
MRSRTERALMMAAAVTAALVMSGCSAQDSAPKVAGDHGEGSSKPQDDNAVRRAWVTCMHEQGQNQVQQDKDGNIFTPAAKTGAEASTAAYEAAVKVCDAKNPGIHQAKAKGFQKFVDEARAWVACARKNGYADLPDPDPKTAVLHIPKQSFDQAKWAAVQQPCSKLPGPSFTIGQ